MTLPSADELIQRFNDDKIFDWVVLGNDGVLVVQPLWPRPDTMQKRAEEIKTLEAANPQTQEERVARNNRREELRYLELELFNDRELYRLPAGQIAQVINFEDLMLHRTDRLLEEGDVRTAYELLRLVELAAPGWEKAIPRFESLLLREAELQKAKGNNYAALALLDELATRNINNPQLKEQFGTIVDLSVGEAVAADDFSQARHLISRLKNHFPDHEVATKWTDQLQQRSARLMTEAISLADQRRFRQAADSAREADRIWSPTGNMLAAYSTILARHQVIRVAVPRLANAGVISPVPLDAGLRDRELTEVSLLEPESAGELTYFQSDYFEKWEPADLGRQVVFSLRATRPYWQSQPILSANQIADTLSDLLNPELPSYSPRMASFVKEFSVRSPTELAVEFSRVPLNIEAMFRFPIVGIPEDERSNPAAKPRTLSSRFVLTEESESHRAYQRRIPEPDGLTIQQYHVAEIVEQRFDTRHEQIQAFRRGDVDVLPHLEPWEVDAFQASGKAFVQQYALPRNHVIVFNPLSKTTHSTQLRRSLSLSINRDSLLKNIILRDPEGKYGRVSGAAWHSQSYATSPLVAPPEYNIRLAFALKFAAEESLRIPDKLKFIAEAKARALQEKQDWDELEFRSVHGEEIKAVAAHIKLPKLKMLCVPEQTALQAAAKMVSVWSKIGIEVELIPADKPGETIADDGWDMMYRVVCLKEPVLDLWPLLTSDDTFDVNRLSAYPDWMRQELINLDYVTSFTDAQEKLFQIHRHIAAQAFLIPLWEVDDFIAFRRNVNGFETRPVTTYQDVERWAVKP
ncbi:MAG: ABC transporter substrate-binding protein [Planctomycetaceae bacterium]